MADREPTGFRETPIGLACRRKENLARLILGAMSFCLVAPLVLIILYLLIKAFPVLSWNFITQDPRNGMREGGIWSPLIGTFYAVGISLAVAAPIGVLAAVYLNEYARDNWLTRAIHLAVVNLAGVPSIVHGLFGLGAFVYFAHLGLSVLSASLTLAIMTLPVIIASTREALGAVPMAFREACWNVGASRWQTIRTIVLPNSVSGILTGVILQVSRAAGETAPILLTGVAFDAAVRNGPIPYYLDDRFMALSMHLYTITQNASNIPEAVPYAIAVVLLGLVLVVNCFSITLRLYLRNRKKW